MSRSLTSLTFTLTLAACGPGKHDTDDGSSSTSSSTTASSPTDATGSTDASSPTDATGSTGATDATGTAETTQGPTSNGTTGTPDTTTGGEADQFGFICVVLKKAESEESDPFVGTEMIRLTLDYEACLSEYYSTHPGQVNNAEVFGAWVDRLCSEPVDAPLVACEVDTFEQGFPDGGPSYMAVQYKVSDAAQIDGRTLLWGPAPLAATAGCEPTAKFTVAGSATGFSQGPPVWTAQSWVNPVGTVHSEATGCIEVAVARVP